MWSLNNGERVDVGAEQHRGTWLPALELEDGPRRRRTEPLCEADGAHPVPHDPGRAVLLEAELRVTVEVTAQFDHLVGHGGDQRRDVR
jgi:hypothetical protein